MPSRDSSSRGGYSESGDRRSNCYDDDYNTDYVSEEATDYYGIALNDTCLFSLS